MNVLSFQYLQKGHSHNTVHYAILSKKRRESSMQNCCINARSVITKAIFIIVINWDFELGFTTQEKKERGYTQEYVWKILNLVIAPFKVRRNYSSLVMLAVWKCCLDCFDCTCVVQDSIINFFECSSL